jgi:chaperonin GroEL (HSP60 family)
VVRLALQDAASVAGLLVTTEAMVAEKPEKIGECGTGSRYRESALPLQALTDFHLARF